MTGHVVFWGLCAVLVFLPLPIGSVEEWAVFVFEAATILLFALYMGGEALSRRRRGPSTGAGEPPRFFKFLVGTFLAVSLLQIVPLPAAAVKVLSPRAYGIYAGLVRDGLSAPSSWLTLSLAPRASLSDLVLVLCYGLFGFLVLRAVRSRRQAEILVLVILASALFQAFYGLAETFSGHEMILGRPKRHGLGSVTGTFVNRNHFAGFLEMAFPLGLGYLLAKARFFAMEKGLSLRRKILWFSQESLQWTLLLALVPVFLGLGIVFSKSRAGIMVLALTALLAAVAASSWRDISGGESGGGARNRGFARPVRLVLAAVLAAAVWLGIGPVVERFAEMDITKEARRVFYANTVELIGDFPLAGTGKGTYVNAYAMYEKVDDRLRLSFAHNDYLEFAAENGVVGGGALALAGIALAVWLAALWRRRRGGFAKGVGLGALLGVVAILVHGLTDFNLQIPANAVYFATLAMLAGALLGGERGETPNAGARCAPGSAPERRRRSGHGAIGPAVAALAGLVLLVPAWRDFRGFRCLGKYRQVRREARSVESAFPVLEPLLLKAVDSSGQALFRVELARLYGEMARVANGSGRAEEREAFCDKAVASYAGAVAANPIDASAHYETGAVYLLSNFPLMTYADRAKAYFRKALELKPADESINLNVIFLHFTWWDSLEEGERPYAAGLYRAAVARDPAFASKLEARWKQSFPTNERLAAILAELPR